jgi:hypothetical protein
MAGNINSSEVSNGIKCRGKINNVFVLPVPGLVLNLTEIEGHPKVGEMVQVGSKCCKILELGRNSTDGRAVSTRSCLTGRTVAPYGAIRVEWDGPKPKDLRGEWVIGEDSE